MVLYIYLGLIKTVANFRRGSMDRLLLSFEYVCPVNLVLHVCISYANYVTKNKIIINTYIFFCSHRKIALSPRKTSRSATVWNPYKLLGIKKIDLKKKSSLFSRICLTALQNADERGDIIDLI